MTAESQSNTRLPDHRLIYTRLIWAAIVLFYLSAFVAALPMMLSQGLSNMQQPQGWTEAELHTSLTQLGISYDAFRTYNVVNNLFFSLVFFGLGTFIYLRRPDDWVALLFSLFFITFTGTAIFGALARSQPAWTTIYILTNSLSSMTFIVLLLFPDGRFAPRWMRWVALGFAGIQIWRIFQPDLYDQVAFASILPVFFCMIGSQIYRYRRVSTPIQKQQTKWVVYGLIVGFMPLIIFLLIDLSTPELSQPGVLGMAMFLLGNLLWTLCLVCIVGSVTISILHSHLWDIDVIIRRTLVYVGLSGTLALIYIGSVLLLQNLFGILTGRSQSPLVIVISTLAIAALFNPLRKRIQNDIDRRFYRRKYNVEKMLQAFSTSLRQEVELDEISRRLLAAAVESMQPERIELWLAQNKEKQKIDS